MKVNIGTVITDIKKNVIKEGFTVGEAIINILLANYEDEVKIPGTEKLRRYTLSESIESSKSEVDLSIDDISLIKKYLDKAGAHPILYTAIYTALEGVKQVDGNESNPS